MDTQQLMSDFYMYFENHGLNLILALTTLVVGWIVLILLAYFFRKYVLAPLKINRHFENIAFKLDIEKIIVRVMFVIGLVLLFRSASQIADLQETDDFFNTILVVLGNLLFTVVKTILPLVVALVAAWLTKRGILFLGHSFKLDQRIGSKLDAGEAVNFSFTKSLSEIGYGLVFLFFLPAILAGLGLQDISQPLQAMTQSALSFLPNLFGAAIILAIGWFVAKIIKEVVTGLLFSIGADSALNKMNIEQVTGGVKFSKLGGTFAYAVVLLLVFIEALKKLSLDAITDPILNVLNQFFLAVPHILYAAFLLFVTYFIAVIVKQIVTQVLEGIGFNSVLSKLGFNESYTRTSPSKVVGVLVFYILMILASIEALQQLGLESISEILAEITVFSAQVLFGIVILGLGIFIANLVSRAIKNSTAPNANLLAQMARVGILVLVGAMALQRMGIAEEIVNITFGLILGSIALAAGIAFGLGGREEAADIIKQIRSKFR